MKKQAKLTAFCAAFTALGFAFSASGAEPAEDVTAEKTTTRVIPFANYWDSFSWDRSGGGLFFWHKQSDDRPALNKARQNPRADKKSRSIVPLSSR